jgi:hypothetical protein
MPLLNADDYAALKALYQSTNGAKWTANTGWKDWDFNSTAPPDTSDVKYWKGVTVSTAGRVTGLDLIANNLSGSIPAELGNLSQLQTLYLTYNNLSGSIPAALGNLSQLQGFSLNGNQLSGSIPAALGNLTQLTYLNLSSNQLSGSIPAELGNLTQLRTLYLVYNQLSGTIPASLATNIKNNQFSGISLDNSPTVAEPPSNQTAEAGKPLPVKLTLSDLLPSRQKIRERVKRYS